MLKAFKQATLREREEHRLWPVAHNASKESKQHSPQHPPGCTAKKPSRQHTQAYKQANKNAHKQANKNAYTQAHTNAHKQASTQACARQARLSRTNKKEHEQMKASQSSPSIESTEPYPHHGDHTAPHARDLAFATVQASPTSAPPPPRIRIPPAGLRSRHGRRRGWSPDRHPPSPRPS